MKSFIKNREDEDTTFKPQLTSLIDVMTILLVFLIKSFSVEGNIVTPAKDLVLPNSESTKNAKSALSIEISQNRVMHGGASIVSLDELKASDSLMVKGLFNSLLKTKEHINIENQKKIMIQCDKEVKFSIIKQIMYTCSKAGFSEYSVLVTSG